MKHRWLAGLSAIPVAVGSTIAALAVVAAPTGAAPTGPVVQTFSTCTGSEQQWTPPSGVDTFVVEVFGAQGGAGSGGRPSGKGGSITATFQRVAPNSAPFRFTVGCRGRSGAEGGQGGAANGNLGRGGNGGGAAPGLPAGGGGGGVSSLVAGSGAFAIIAAGGGGGGGAGPIGLNPNSGAGGGGVGGLGSSQAGNPGFLISIKDLLGSISKPLAQLLDLNLALGAKGGGACANPGSAGVGGSPDGKAGIGLGGGGKGGGGGSTYTYGGGGGGGGVQGGGGGGSSSSGAAGGGGGCAAAGAMSGSPYTLSNITTATGVRSGDGLVRVTYTPAPPAPTTPAVTNVLPSSGFAGDSVLIQGTNFLVTSKPSCIAPIVAHFGNADTLVGNAAESQMIVNAPTHAPGSVDVTVTNNCGETSPVSAAGHFTYQVHE